MSIEKVKDTIRKILNLSRDDAATEGEVRNAVMFAKRMMDEHNLSEEDLGEDEGQECLAQKLADIVNAEVTSYRVSTQSRAISEWERDLATLVANVTGCKLYTSGEEDILRDSNGIAQFDGRGNIIFRRGIVFYGVAEDVHLAAELHNNLALLVVSMTRLRCRASSFTGKGRSYAMGLVDGMTSQIEEEDAGQKLLRSESSSRALVVQGHRLEIAKAKHQRADRYLESQGIELTSSRPGRGIRRDDAFVWLAGKEDGKRVDVSANRKLKLTEAV